MRTDIYFIQSGPGGPIKIGITNASIERRMSGLQSGNPVKLYLICTVPGDVDLERQLHRQFAAGSISGEWFSPDTPGLASLIKSIIDDGRLPDWFLGTLEEPARTKRCATCAWLMEAELWERDGDRCWTCLRDAAAQQNVPATSEATS